MKDTNEELNGGVQDGAPEENISTVKVKKRPKIFTIEGLNLVLSVIFGLTLLYCIIIGLLNPYLHWYGEAEGKLVISQNLRAMLLILIPFVLEKFFGIKLDYKLVFFLYFFGFCATVLGEACKVYYMDINWDKILHGVSGCMQVYIAFGIAQAMLKSSNSKYKFAFALFIAFLGSMAVASLWEILEFSSDSLFDMNMQKVMAFPNADGDWNTKLDYGATIEDIGEFYKSPAGYRMGIMDTMMDMVWCLICSIGFIGLMIVVRLIKKNAFENSVVYNADYRFGFIKNRKKKKLAAAVVAEAVEGEAAATETTEAVEDEAADTDADTKTEATDDQKE